MTDFPRTPADTLTAATDTLQKSVAKAPVESLTAATATLQRNVGKSLAESLTAAVDSVSRRLNAFRTFTATVTPSGSLGKLIRKIVASAAIVPAAIFLHSDAFWTYVTARFTVNFRGFRPLTMNRYFAPAVSSRTFKLTLIKNEAVSTLDTVPDELELAVGEQVPINIDCTNVLLSGEVIQGSPVPTAAVTSYTNGVSIAGAISGAVTINGNLLQVVLVGSVLKKSQSYYLIVTFNTSATKKLNVRTKLNVIF